MSSHHIVRDEQEPALLILNAEWLQHETLASLLEWSPTIIVPATEVETLLMLGIKPDVVVSTAAERRAMEEEWEAFAPLTLLERQAEESCIVSSLHFLVARKYKAVNILARPHGYNQSELQLFFGNMDIVFYDSISRWLWIRNEYSKWLMASTKLILSSYEPIESIQLNGLKKSKGNAANTFVLEVSKDQIVSINSGKPFMLEEPI